MKKRYVQQTRVVAYPLMSRERYFELFGMPPEEIFTAEQLRRIDELVQRKEQNAIMDE